MKYATSLIRGLTGTTARFHDCATNHDEDSTSDHHTTQILTPKILHLELRKCATKLAESIRSAPLSCGTHFDRTRADYAYKAGRLIGRAMTITNAALQNVQYRDWKDTMESLDGKIEQVNSALELGHPDTFLTLHACATGWQERGNHGKALILYQDLMDKVQDAYEHPSHPYILAIQHALAGAYFATGQKDKAIDLLEAVVEQDRMTTGEESGVPEREEDKPMSLESSLVIRLYTADKEASLKALELATAHDGKTSPIIAFLCYEDQVDMIPCGVEYVKGEKKPAGWLTRETDPSKLNQSNHATEVEKALFGFLLNVGSF